VEIEFCGGLLGAVVGAAIDAQPDDESRAYWKAVYAALME